MAKVKFTAGRVAGFKCELGKNQSFFWCDTVPGLAVRVTSNGAKSYIFQAKVNGKTMRSTIGSVQAWGIDAAGASTAVQFGNHISRLEPVMGQRDHAVKPQVGYLVNHFRLIAPVVGIVIGVAAVIAMLAVGNGAQASITGSITSIGTNLLFVFSGNQDGPPGAWPLDCDRRSQSSIEPLLGAWAWGPGRPDR